MADSLVFFVDKDGWTGGLQVSLNQLDENQAGWGYRLYGPKYNGSSENVLRFTLGDRDAAEIRKMLDTVFPVKEE
ncbi:hypothetical protein [Streptomyces decoyicus]